MPEDVSASPHIVTLKHTDACVEDVVDRLRQEKIVCGARNGRLRVSLAPYNNSADIDALWHVLAT